MVSGDRPGPAGPGAPGEHGIVIGADELNLELADCEIVAQSYHELSNNGTRLYHVEGNTYGLSRFSRGAGQDWREEFVTAAPLAFVPAALDRSVLAEAVDEAKVPTLADEDFAAIEAAYSDACLEAIWSRIREPRTNNGLVLRPPLCVVEAHGWRDDLRTRLGESLTGGQVEAVLDAVMAARPGLDDWTWARLYAVYVARLQWSEPEAEDG